MGIPNKRRPRYRLAADFVCERFGEKTLIYLPSEDLILTVNNSAAALLELLKDWFSASVFSEAELGALIYKNYRLTEAKANKEASLIIKSCSKYQLLKKI